MFKDTLFSYKCVKHIASGKLLKICEYQSLQNLVIQLIQLQMLTWNRIVCPPPRHPNRIPVKSGVLCSTWEYYDLLISETSPITSQNWTSGHKFM